LQQYEQALRDNAIDAFVLSELTAEDLKDIGVELVGHRRKLSPPFPHCAAALRRIRPRLRSTSSVGSTRLSAEPDHRDGVRNNVVPLFGSPGSQPVPAPQ